MTDIMTRNSPSGCAICGKAPVAGRTYSHRGMPKKKGGVGRRTTRKNKRRFLPNLQRVRAVLHGAVKRIKVCTDCLKSGRVHKPSQVHAHAS